MDVRLLKSSVRVIHHFFNVGDGFFSSILLGFVIQLSANQDLCLHHLSLWLQLSNIELIVDVTHSLNALRLKLLKESTEDLKKWNVFFCSFVFALVSEVSAMTSTTIHWKLAGQRQMMKSKGHLRRCP